MVRHRSIFCSECGHYLQARATHCPNCGTWTEREKRAWIARGLTLLAALLMAGIVYRAIEGFGTAVVPH
jgi:uncharacterized paraquat-inducible protein A